MFTLKEVFQNGVLVRIQRRIFYVTFKGNLLKIKNKNLELSNKNVFSLRLLFTRVSDSH